MYTKALPAKFHEEMSNIYHITSYDAATKILNSKTIFSNDPRNQANFSAKQPKPSLALNIEVSLKFAWKGEQRMFFGDPFAKEPDFESGGIKANILYHICNDVPSEEGAENLIAESYWQSHLYPGTTDIIFISASSVFKLNSVPFWKRIMFKSAREEHAEYTFNQQITLEFEKYVGTKIKVPFDKV